MTHPPSMPRLRQRIRSSAVVAALALTGCKEQHAATPASPPTAAAAAACRPTFSVDGQLSQAGTAFVVEPAPGAPPLVATAIHLFGPDGGLDAQIPAAQLPARVRLVRCERLDGKGDVPGGPALLIAEAMPYQPSGTLRDIVAFRPALPHGTDLPRLKLAAAEPTVGSAIWMLAAVRNRPSAQLLHRATVRSTGPEVLEYRFDDQAADLQATSGAAMVDGTGALVGINLVSFENGGERTDGGDTLAETRRLLDLAR